MGRNLIATRTKVIVCSQDKADRAAAAQVLAPSLYRALCFCAACYAGAFGIKHGMRRYLVGPLAAGLLPQVDAWRRCAF